MDIRQLRYFIAIAEEKQITAAAKKLHISQPPLSQQLKLMEEEMGVPLVTRHGKFLKLTAPGETLYNYALTIIKLTEEAHQEVKEVGKGIKGKLKIGINTLSDDRLAKILQTFHQKYPQITYKIQKNETAQLCRLIKERELDLALVRLPIEIKDFEVQPLKIEQFYFLTSRKLQLPSKQVTLEQIQDYPLILPSIEGLGLYQKILEEFARQQLKPNIICESSDMTILLELVSSNFGTTVVPETVLKLQKGYDIQAYEITGTKLAASSGIIWLKNHYLSKGAQHFIDLFR